MKKYFIAALALVAAVACSKDDVANPVLDTSMKSVTLNIGNMATGVRAAIEGAETEKGVNATASTKVDEKFFVMFAKADGTIVKVYQGGTNGTIPAAVGSTYTFHKLPETVRQVAIIGNYTGTAPVAGDHLSTYEEAWEAESEATVKADYKNLLAYGKDDLTNSNTCTTVNEHGNTLEYPLYTADVTVAPHKARIEITKIACDDDAAYNLYSYIGVVSVKMAGVTGGNSYIHNFTAFSETNLPSNNVNNVLCMPSSKLIAPQAGNVWSWNIAPQAVSNIVTELYVEGNGYTTAIPTRTVTITSYANGSTPITQFEAGKIYNFAIDFDNANIDNVENYICAEVDVTIQDWEVVPVTVGFQNN